MKVWVITHCAAEENGTPVVAGSKEKATSILKEIYDNLVNDFEDSITYYIQRGCFIYLCDN